LACHKQTDADPVPDPAYNFDAHPDSDPDFYLMRMRIWMRIQVSKMMRIYNIGSQCSVSEHIITEGVKSRD
jgi:hypothetical protein